MDGMGLERHTTLCYLTTALSKTRSSESDGMPKYKKSTEKHGISAILELRRLQAPPAGEHAASAPLPRFLRQTALQLRFQEQSYVDDDEGGLPGKVLTWTEPPCYDMPYILHSSPRACEAAMSSVSLPRSTRDHDGGACDVFAVKFLDSKRTAGTP